MFKKIPLFVLILLGASCGNVINDVDVKEPNQANITSENLDVNKFDGIQMPLPFKPTLPGYSSEPVEVEPIPTPPPIAIPPIPAPPPIAAPNPIVIPPIPTPPPVTVVVITPPQPDPDPTNEPPTTGSTEPKDTKEVITVAQSYAQYYHPRFGRPPGPDLEFQQARMSAVVKGIDSDDYIRLDIPKPPKEFNTCVSGAMLRVFGEYPVITEKFKFGDWWLVASRIGFNRLTPEKPVYFYWATYVAENEIGIVPANFSTDIISLTSPQNNSIDLQYAILPYIWVDQIIIEPSYPHMPEECDKQ